MSTGDSSGEVPLTRRPLGDLTNHCRKRAISSDTGKLACGKNANFETLDYGGVEGLLSKKGKTLVTQTADGKGKYPAFLTAARPGKYVIPGHAGGSGQENARPDVSYFTKENEKLNSLHLMSSDPTGHRITEGGGSRSSSFVFGSEHSQCNISEDTSPESEETQEDCEDSSYFTANSVQMEKRPDISFTSNENKVNGGDTLTQEFFDKHCSFGSSGAYGSTGLKTAGIEGLPNLPDTLVGSGNNVGDVVGSEKACSCSLCLKAAYMWTDLHYQDTRGRLAAFKSS